MQLHTLKRKHPNRKAKQVGRGGTRGKTSGRGGKGQTARAGNKRRPQLRDIIKKIPKLRGYKFKPVADKFFAVNVRDLNVFDNGATVSPETLFENKLIKNVSGKLPRVKILGTGDIEKKLSIVSCSVSKSAKDKIEKAGGNIK